VLAGLPASAGSKRNPHWKAGRYSTHGVLPKVVPNVELHPGWFNETVPQVLARHPGEPIAFLHMDADIYTSTRSVLDAVFSRCVLRVGTVIAFDELFGPPAQAEHEYRALLESSEQWGIHWEFVTYTLTPKSEFARAAVQITYLGPGCALGGAQIPTIAGYARA